MQSSLKLHKIIFSGIKRCLSSFNLFKRDLQLLIIQSIILPIIFPDLINSSNNTSTPACMCLRLSWKHHFKLFFWRKNKELEANSCSALARLSVVFPRNLYLWFWCFEQGIQPASIRPVISSLWMFHCSGMLFDGKSVFCPSSSRMLRFAAVRGGLGLLAVRRASRLSRSSHSGVQTEYKPIKKVMVANRGKKKKKPSSRLS